MTIASIELQKGLYTHLSSGSYEVYELVPPNTDMPYITIGNITKANSYTKTNRRYTFSCTIHSWSRGTSSLEQKTIDEFIQAGRFFPIVFSVGDNPVPLALMALPLAS